MLLLLKVAAVVVMAVVAAVEVVVVVVGLLLPAIPTAAMPLLPASARSRSAPALTRLKWSTLR